MRTFWIAKGIKIAFFVVLFGAAMAYVVMMLWNWLMPAIVGASIITFWQAVGILILAKILFGFGRGSWGYGGHWGYKRHYYWKNKMEDRLKNMTPEDREKFREEWRSRCGRWGHRDWMEEKKTEEQPKTTL